MRSFVSSPRKKIAVFGIKTYPAFGGADRVVENLLEVTSEKFEYYIYLIRTDNKIPDSSNKHFIYLPALAGKHLEAFSFYLLCTLHMLIRGRYDLIHAHKSDVGLFTYLLRLKYGTRIIGTFHGNPYESSKWGELAKAYLILSERLFIRSCNKLTSVSANKKINKSIYFIPNGIESLKVEMFRNYQNSTVNYDEMKVQKGAYILFACGRICRSKGLHRLLDAYKNGFIQHQLVIIGDFSHERNYNEEIEEKINALAFKNIIVMKKLLPKRDLFDLVRHSRLVVFPSENEAMSMFLMEVLACRKIIVSSDIEANTAILGKDYKYLFNNKNADSLAGVIKTALSDIDARSLNNIGKLEQKIMRKYNWRSIQERYAMLYKTFF